MKKESYLLLSSYGHVIHLNDISRILVNVHYFVKSLFSLIYKSLVLTLFDKIRNCFEILT